jgi:hypothetical protein
MAYLDLANTLVSDRQRELHRVAATSHHHSRRLFWRRIEPQLLAPTTVLDAPVVRTTTGASEPAGCAAAA